MDKDRLLSARTNGTREVELPDVGTVTVRALTRREVYDIRELAQGAGDLERHMLAAAMVDPEMSLEDVDAWYSVSPAGEIEPVVQAIVDLSGMAQGAERETMRRFRNGAGASV